VSPVGLPRTYLVCLLIVKTLIRRDRSGGLGALQLAGYWEVFSPGPLTLSHMAAWASYYVT
jgi:hypothetical protein